MKIYAACLASYNNGVLHGAWIEVEDAAQVQEEIAAMLRESPYPNVRVECTDCDGDGSHIGATLTTQCDTCGGRGTVPSAEEYAIYDYDEIPSTFGEYPSIDKIVAYCDAVNDLSTYEVAAFGEWYEVEAPDDPSADDFRDAYAGTFNSWEDFAADYIENAGMLADVPDNVARYFDYEAYGRDMRLGGDAWESNGHYFWSR